MQIRSKLNKDSKSFWKEVSALMGRAGGTLDEMEINGHLTDDDVQKIADSFIKFFLEKERENTGNYENEEWNVLLRKWQRPNQENVSVVPLSKEEVTRAFARLSNKKSAGLDAIPGFLLKSLSPTLINPITSLFNSILSTNQIPPVWKLLGNFRPVSNLISLAKLFELCLLARLEMFDLDELMGTSQHGFRAHHSTTSAAASIVNRIAEHMDMKQTVLCYSADLTAAFDLLRKEVEIMIRKGIPIYLVICQEKKGMFKCKTECHVCVRLSWDVCKAAYLVLFFSIYIPVTLPTLYIPGLQLRMRMTCTW